MGSVLTQGYHGTMREASGDVLDVGEPVDGVREHRDLGKVAANVAIRAKVKPS